MTELAITLPSESTRSTRSVLPPTLPCINTESTIDRPNFTLTTPTFTPPSTTARDSSTTVRSVAGSAVACAELEPMFHAVCHQPSSLCTKSEDGDVVTAL